jgi:hypothetical protein
MRTLDHKERQNLLEEIGIEKLENELTVANWELISRRKNLSEEFIREFQKKLNLNTLFQYNKLSEDFIREFIHKVDWYIISYYQQLSESFIREFSNKVDWFAISETHYFSDEFIEEFKEKIHWKIFFQENYVKYEIIKRNILRTNIKHIDEFKTFHLNETQIREIDKLLKLKRIF